MKYELETIPVWEAYEADAACPLCFLAERLEKQYVKFYLGDSVMTPEIRVKVNRRGFCPHHWRALLGAGNKLGLALMAGTYIETVRETLASEQKKLTGRKGPTAKVFESSQATMIARTDDCLICERLQYTLSNYAYTVARLFTDDATFRQRFQESRGFCLTHLPFALRVGRKTLSGAEFSRYADTVFGIIDHDLAAVHEDLAQFTGQFDYRATGPVTEAMKAATPRAVAKLAGTNPTGH